MEKVLYTIAEAAEASGLSQRSIRYLIDDGRLLVVYKGRKPLVKATSLQTFSRKNDPKPIRPKRNVARRPKAYTRPFFMHPLYHKAEDGSVSIVAMGAN